MKICLAYCPIQHKKHDWKTKTIWHYYRYQKNRLYVTIADKVTKKDLDKLYTDLRFSVADLRPGFNIISDLSQCRLACLNAIPTFRKIMNYLINNNTGEMIGVVPGNNLIHRQIINLGTRFQGYKPIFVSSLEDAEDKLKHSTKRNGLRFLLPHLQIDCLIGDVHVKGHILDISTSGLAALLSSTGGIAVEDEISITVSFEEQDLFSGGFKIKTKIIRVDDNSIAAEFTNLTNEQKEQLWNCLVKEPNYKILLISYTRLSFVNVITSHV